MTNERLAYTISEAAKLAGVSRPTFYTWMKREGFPAFKIGGCVRIPARGFAEWLERQTEVSPADRW